MNCKRFQYKALFLVESEFPSELSAHLQQCSACRAWVKQQKKISGLLALKNDEQPDAAFEQRNVLSVHLRISEWLDAQKKAAESAPRWQGWALFSGAAWRYAAIAVLMAGVLFVLETRNHKPEVKTPTLAEGTVPAETTPSFSEPFPSTPAPTNQHRPKKIQYGPGNSRVVDFEY